MATRERLVPVQPQRPKPWNEKAVQKIIDRAGYVLVQTKYDGMRAHILYWQGKLTVVTREGIEIEAITHNEWLMAQIDAQLELTFGIRKYDYALDCELVIQGQEFNVMSGNLRRRKALSPGMAASVRFYAFDTPFNYTLVNGSVHSPSCTDRIRTLDALAVNGPIWPAEGRITWTLDTIQELYKAYREFGFEGLVVKDPAEQYQNGKRGNWYKVKNECSEDGRVIGFVEGSGLNDGLYVGFVVELESGVRVCVTGIARSMMLEITSSPDTYHGRYIEVEYMDKTPDGSLRHPRFKCFRDMEAAPGIKS